MINWRIDWLNEYCFTSHSEYFYHNFVGTSDICSARTVLKHGGIYRAIHVNTMFPERTPHLAGSNNSQGILRIYSNLYSHGPGTNSFLSFRFSIFHNISMHIKRFSLKKLYILHLHLICSVCTYPVSSQTYWADSICTSLTFVHETWTSIGVIYLLGASIVPCSRTLKQMGQKILSGQHLNKNHQFYLDLWPCDLKINRVIYSLMA